MNQTSLQNIITRNTSGIRDNEIRQFFLPQKYPRFEIDDLKARAHLMQHSHFLMFMGVLQRWNEKVKKEDPTLNQTDYRKNEFIFSWLKSIAVQNSKFFNSSLNQLHQWYASNGEFDFPRRVRPENTDKSRLEDWEIRNSYKSNMPLEIENYRRKILMQTDSNAEPQAPETPNNALSKVKSVGRIQSSKQAKKQNNYLRGIRQDEEMSEFQTNFKRTKVNFYKNMSKNYFKPEFLRDKLLKKSLKELKKQNDVSSFLKDYRMKTSIGFRTLGQSSSSFGSPNRSFTRTQPGFFRYTKGDMSSSCVEGSPGKLNVSSIDGLSLMHNPFEVKLRKKKK